MSKGIDYGLGQSNIDHATGIRFGVIQWNGPACEALTETMEAEYGEPTCTKCGGAVVDGASIPDDASIEPPTYGCLDYICPTCKQGFDSGDCYPEEPLGWHYEGDGYTLEDCLDSDVIITKSPYYTIGPFCSPCVPGAISLDSDSSTPSPEEYDADPDAFTDYPRGYCLGHDWFEGGIAPYPIWRVSDGVRIVAVMRSTPCDEEER